MLYTAPELDERELQVLDEIDGLKVKLKYQLHEPNRWSGSLRRLSFARNIQGSNSIEGFEAKLDDAAAVAMGEEPLDADEETRLALAGYRDAMTYVLQLSTDEDFSFDEQLFKSLHFMMTSYAMKNRPGRWRSGAIYVQRDGDGEIVYEGADADLVATLMKELAVSLNDHAADHPLLCGAMAHLNLVMVHPFKDGNGRMARCLQSLVLARNGVLSPVFMSVEEYLGRNTQSYYDILAAVGQGAWHPEHDARPWIRYMLTAHVRQARTILNRVKESELLWRELDALAVKRGLPDRAVFALYDTAFGIRVRNSTYRAVLEEADDAISEQSAGADLRKMVDSGLLVAWGEKRGRHYNAGSEITAIMRRIRTERIAKDKSDPFAP